MKVLFYSNQCKFSKLIIEHLDNNNLTNNYKLFNVDINKAPDFIEIVPSLFDRELNQLLVGKQVFEYFTTNKYFYNPTNNIHFKKPINPNIPNDNKALDKYEFNNNPFNNSYNNPYYDGKLFNNVLNIK
jgi:hypothetical protein